MTVRVWTCWFCERVLTSPPRGCAEYQANTALPHPDDYCLEKCALADLAVDIIVGSYRYPEAKAISGGVGNVLARIEEAQWPMTSR